MPMWNNEGVEKLMKKERKKERKHKRKKEKWEME